MDNELPRPAKTREVRNFVMDSTVWNDFQYRDDDIVVATYVKAGTTWMQMIVAQFVFEGETDDIPVGDVAIWVDMRLPPWEEKKAVLQAQPHRRFLKTHLPADALVFSPTAKYIYVGRDGRDVIWSGYNHHKNLEEWILGALRALPDLGPVPDPGPADMREFFYRWFEGDGWPFWPMWENVRSWWAIRHHPNVLFMHYQNLKDDLPGCMRRVGEFLGYRIDESRWPKMVEHCTFDYMKTKAPRAAPLGGSLWKGGTDTFIHKGTNGRWRDVLTPDDVALYERRAREELGPACAHWLATGELLE